MNAPADSDTVTGTSFGSIVADSALSRVFVSVPGSNAIAVVGFSGKPVRVLRNVYGASAMILVGSTLYVSESTDGSVVAINPRTFARRTVVRGIDQPSWLAYAGRRLWVSAATTSGTDSGALKSIDLKTRRVTTSTYTFYYPPDLATSPKDPYSLFLTIDGLDPEGITRFYVRNGNLIVGPETTTDDFENIRQIAVTPDGKSLIPASGSPYDFEELTTKTMQLDGVIYPGAPYPSAVATSAGNGGVLATALQTNGDPDIYVDRIGTPKAFVKYSTPDTNRTNGIAPHGLALSSDGRRLFAVSIGFKALDLSIFRLPKS